MTNYGALVESYEFKRPKRGDLLRGEILHVDDETILVDVGAKRDAIVPRKEVDKLDDDQLDDLNVGDHIPVYVLRASGREEELQVSIQKGKQKRKWDRAKELLQSGETLELEVIETNRGGVLVSFGELRGFVPNSHLPGLRQSDRYDLNKNKEKLIGTSIPLKVIEANLEKRRLVFSARGTGNDYRTKKLEELTVGSVVEGTVAHIVDFGAFVDLGGVDGLVHISELDWSKVDHPSDILEIGETIKVLIQDVDIEKGRVGLSRKELLPSPWDTVDEKYSVGDYVEGEITSVLGFGAFVRLQDGVVGLIHESEMGIEGPFYPKDILKSGEVVIARILRIESEKRRMSLSIRTNQDEFAS